MSANSSELFIDHEKPTASNVKVKLEKGMKQTNASGIIYFYNLKFLHFR